MISFYALQVSFEQIFFGIRKKKPDKILWARLKEKSFALQGKLLEHLESGEIFCVRRSKCLSVSACPVYKILGEMYPVFVQ